MKAGGWQINGVTALQGGLRFTVGVGSPVRNNAVRNRADRVTDGSLSRDQRTLARFFDTTAFRTPAQFQYGNSGRFGQMQMNPSQLSWHAGLVGFTQQLSPRRHTEEIHGAAQPRSK